MVETLYLVPTWFYQIDILLGLLFSIITAFVALYAIKIYKITDEKEFKLFGISFILISLSYLIRICLNSLLTIAFKSKIFLALTISQFNIIHQASVITYILLFLIGYLTLAYTTLKINNTWAYFLILIPTIIAIITCTNKALTIYLLAASFLLVMCVSYMDRLIRKKEKKVKAITFAITMLLISNIIFMFITKYSFYQGYIISSILDLIAYLVIATNLFLIISHGQKKKQT